MRVRVPPPAHLYRAPGCRWLFPLWRRRGGLDRQQPEPATGDHASGIAGQDERLDAPAGLGRDPHWQRDWWTPGWRHWPPADDPAGGARFVTSLDPGLALAASTFARASAAVPGVARGTRGAAGRRHVKLESTGGGGAATRKKAR